MSSTKDTTVPRMEFRENGPIKVSSLENLVDPEGKAIPSQKVIVLCRCGRSKTKPFCNGTHKASGFSDQKTSDGKWDERVNYVGKKITIHDNRGICSHAGFCTDNLPAVWRMKQEPWIDPDAAGVDKIIEVVRQCPSGALSYTIDDVEHRDQNREPTVRATKDGPFFVQGEISIEGVAQGEGASGEHFALCRCGESTNKPFCDGTHWSAHFKSDNSVKVADLADMKDDQPLHVQVDGLDLVVIKSGTDLKKFRS
jgi:CDGSH-type Zn-finger protein